jgi:hypothetical protein
MEVHAVFQFRLFCQLIFITKSEGFDAVVYFQLLHEAFFLLLHVSAADAAIFKLDRSHRKNGGQNAQESDERENLHQEKKG